jgi:hypothetical protein
VFVFDGLQFGRREPESQTRAEQARAFEQAWELYDQQRADQVVDAFSNAGTYASDLCQPLCAPPLLTSDGCIGTPKPTELYRFLQRILFENGIDFMVAPYSASAQVILNRVWD